MDDTQKAQSRALWEKVGKLVIDAPDLPERVTPERLAKALSRFIVTLPATDLALAIPCKRTCEEETLSAAMHLCHEAGLRGISVHSFEIANNREYLVQTAIRAGCDRLLFLDSDTVIDAKALWQLMRTMDRTGAAVVAGLCKMRDTLQYNAFFGDDPGPYKQCEKSDIPTTGVAFPVHHVGLAVSLLDLVQIGRVKPPRFCRKAEGLEHWGEDQMFCMWLRHHGLDLVVDPKVSTIHVTDHMFGYKWEPAEGEAAVGDSRPMTGAAQALAESVLAGMATGEGSPGPIAPADVPEGDR